jgi:hypothetical protein
MSMMNIAVITVTAGEHPDIEDATSVIESLMQKGLITEFRPVPEIDAIEVIPAQGADRTQIMQTFIDEHFNVIERE